MNAFVPLMELPCMTPFMQGGCGPGEGGDTGMGSAQHSLLVHSAALTPSGCPPVPHPPVLPLLVHTRYFPPPVHSFALLRCIGSSGHDDGVPPVPRTAVPRGFGAVPGAGRC